MKRLTFICRLLWIAVVSIFSITVSLPTNAQELAAQMVMEIQWNVDARYVATGQYNGAIDIWDAFSGVQWRALNGHTDSITALDWQPDGQRLLTSSFDGTARIWDVAAGVELMVLKHEDWVTEARWRPGRSEILTGMAYGDAYLWDATSGTQLRAFPMGSVNEFVWAWNLERVLHANPAGAVAILDGETFKVTQFFYELKDYTLENAEQVEENAVTVTKVAWQPGGNLVASGNGIGQVRVRDADTGEIALDLLATDKPRTFVTGSAVIALAFSPDGAQLQTVTSDGTMRLWDVQTGALLAEEDAGTTVSAAAWSPYLGRVAYGAMEVNGEDMVTQTFTASGELSIAVPFASPERLDALTAACIATASDPEAASALNRDRLPAAFLTQLEALPADSIHPACAADLEAMALAVQAKAQ
jgi:WD40 repeat protein